MRETMTRDWGIRWHKYAEEYRAKRKQLAQDCDMGAKVRMSSGFHRHKNGKEGWPGAGGCSSLHGPISVNLKLAFGLRWVPPQLLDLLCCQFVPIWSLTGVLTMSVPHSGEWAVGLLSSIPPSLPVSDMVNGQGASPQEAGPVQEMGRSSLDPDP